MITWIKNGQELRLDTKPFILMAHDNFGMVSAPRIEDSAPQQHGTTDRGFKLPARNIVLYIELFGDNWEHYYQLRDSLIRWFSADMEAGILRVQEGGFIREISGYVVDGLGFPDSERSFQSHVVPVVIHCPDPLWRSAEEFIATIQGGGSLDVGAVPTVIPFTVGTSTFNTFESVNYLGSFDSAPESVKIVGPITDPVISNSGTGKQSNIAKIDFTGTTIAAGDYFLIELGYGKNTIVDKYGNNKIDKLSPDSDLAGFVFSATKPNSVNVTGSAIAGETLVQFLWREKYLGI
jgi:hypothetical protein